MNFMIKYLEKFFILARLPNALRTALRNGGSISFRKASYAQMVCAAWLAGWLLL